MKGPRSDHSSRTYAPTEEDSRGVSVAFTGFEVLQLFGQVREGDRWARLRARFALGTQTYLTTTIGGGTSEIQRNIIALSLIHI